MNLARLRVPSLDGLLAFEAAARYGTFERAAEVLCITGSAAAKRVAAVEQLLGVQLLDRSGKTLVLTDIGREYLQQVAGPLRLLAAGPLHQSDEKRKARVRTPYVRTPDRRHEDPRVHEPACLR
jgi:DNA-binding transcriptional LysR family regulator